MSGSRLLDSLGKGFTDYIRDKVVDIPEEFLLEISIFRKERKHETAV